MKTKNTIAGFLFALLIGTSAMAQQEVNGKVSDQDGLPLAGVNIVEKNTSNGTTTDFDGNFTIVVGPNATLVFSYIGFQTVESPVGSQRNLNIQMMEGVALDEVQLVGSRNPNRTSTDTPVPVDVIDVAEVATQSGRIEVNELLQ